MGEFELKLKQQFMEALETLLPLRNPPMLDGIDDLTLLSHLHEATSKQAFYSVLHNLRYRYLKQKSIYTYSGLVLVAINPFQSLDELYSVETVEIYSGKLRAEVEPHLFAIAEEAFQCLSMENRNQTVIVSGESGAGKTVSAKFIMRFNPV
jgi:myosin-5